MYFCEDHASFSEDGTVRYCGDNDNETIVTNSSEDLNNLEADQCAPVGNLVMSISDNAVSRHISPNSSSPHTGPGLQLEASSTFNGTLEQFDSSSELDDNQSETIVDLSFQEVEGRSFSAPNSPHLSTCSSPLLRQQRGRQRVVSSSEQPPPPPYPGGSQVMLAPSSPGCALSSTQLFNGLHRVGSNKAFVVPSVGTSYPFQEIREISLGRHNEEPFGMKVESIGDSFYITHVVKGSVAACAGLKMGDEIVRINDRRLDGLKTKDVLQVIRESEVCVKLAYKPRAVVARIREVKIHKSNGVLGLRLQRRSDGIYIDFVKKSTPAFAAGLKDSDQVLKINGHVVTEWSTEGAMALLKSIEDNELLILVVRETLPLAHVSNSNTKASKCTSNGQSPCLSRRISSDVSHDNQLPLQCHNQRSQSDLASNSLSNTPSSSQTGADADPSAKNTGGNPCILRNEAEGPELTSLPCNHTQATPPSKTSQHSSKFSFFKSSKASFKQSSSLSSASSLKDKG